MDDLRGEFELACHRCGQLLGTDPDDEPDGGTDGLPLCGECARNRDEAADFDESGLGAGEIDRSSTTGSY